MKELVKGAYDLHVHPGPDVQVRKVRDLELSRRCIDMGIAGYAIKSHYLCTAERAATVNEIYPQCRAIGTITLNNSVGGLNPVAVEVAARAGAKIVWLPSVDSLYERQFLFSGKKDVILPYWTRILKDLDDTGVPCPPISLTDENGRLRDEVYSIIDIANQYHLCIATSHVSHEDAFAVSKACKEKQFGRLLISHVLYPSTTYTLEEQMEFVRNGALLEYSYSTFTTKKTTYEATLAGIRAIGPDQCIISSDLGMPNGIYPDEGLLNFSKMLYEDGMTMEQIHKMNRDNTSSLING